MEIDAITRKWGNSLVVIIPSNVVETEKFKENEKVSVKIEKKRVKAGALWGLLSDWKKPTEEIIKEARKGWD